jgi:hypothetical protein
MKQDMIDPPPATLLFDQDGSSSSNFPIVAILSRVLINLSGKAPQKIF